VDHFSIVKKHFFINTNNVKGFFLAAARVPLLFEASKEWFTEKQRFKDKNSVLRTKTAF
jgi:hypothetical protein